MHEEFNGRAGIAQRLLQPYRISVYDLIASKCRGGMSVFASRFDQHNIPLTKLDLSIAKFFPAKNNYFFDGKFDLCWQAGLQKWIKTWKPDIVIVEANPRNLSTFPMIHWLHKHRCRVIGHGLGVMPLTSGLEKLRGFGRKGLISLLDGVFAYSSVAAEQYHALGMPTDRIFVAHNATAAKPTKQPPKRPPYFTQRPALLFVGTLIPRKRIDLLLKAYTQIQATPKPILQIVGDGPSKREAQDLADSLKVDCLFLGDLRGPELKQVFEAADLFVLPGTGGLAIQEAMAHALPVIASKADGTEADLVRPENGWLIEPGNISALAKSIDDALSNPPRLRKKGAASYQIVSSEINIESMSATFVRGMDIIALKPLRRN